MRVRHQSGPRLSFWLKAVAAGSLIVVADSLFFADGIGATAGAFGLAWLGLTVVLKPAIRRDSRSAAAAAVAALCAALLFDRFTFVGWGLFWTAISTAALSPRTAALPHAGAWAKRLLIHALGSFVAPFSDMDRVRRLQARPGALRVLMLGAILPGGGGLLFLALFACANPLIATALQVIQLPDPDLLLVSRPGFWLVTGVMVWATFRPARQALRLRTGMPRRPVQPTLFGVSAKSVITALAVFNLLFAVENGLDLAFLWSGAPLPADVTLADYAHRGAYPLVFTAILAGGLSLLLLREGSPTASRPLIRRLVSAWVAQNVLLCASAILRTVDYIEAYSLTQLRLAALLWMGLVMLGLALVGWSMLRRKSASWLINANALALVVALSLASLADLAAVAAWWNVDHARDLGGRGADLDVCYLEALGSSALPPLLHVEQSGGNQGLRERAAVARGHVFADLTVSQADWRRWTWRGARRLAAAKAALLSLPREPAGLREVMSCKGPIAPPISLTPGLRP